MAALVVDNIATFDLGGPARPDRRAPARLCAAAVPAFSRRSSISPARSSRRRPNWSRKGSIPSAPTIRSIFDDRAPASMRRVDADFVARRRGRSDPIVTEPRAGAAAFVETPDPRDLARCEAAWLDLAARAAEPNVFAESAFLIPALRAPGADGSRRDAAGLERRGAHDVDRRRRVASCRACRSAWRASGAANRRGSPAIAARSRRAPREALSAIVAWLRRERRGVAGLRAAVAGDERTDRAGAVAGLRRARVAALGERSIRAGARRCRSGRRRASKPSLDKRRRKEWARQRRRLEERGRLEARVVDDAAAIEAFLALERTRMEGRARHRARRRRRPRRVHARNARRGSRRAASSRVHSLALDGEPIAIGLVLRSGARAFYWKTAYDERFAEYSPGVQLTLDLSRRLEREPGLALIDSCAIVGPSDDRPAVARAARARRFRAGACTPARRAASRWGSPRPTRKQRLRELAKRVITPLLATQTLLSPAAAVGTPGRVASG